ncbi:hypothetical protein Hanom_Chr06g00479801 [Helianthus anomalus]
MSIRVNGAYIGEGCGDPIHRSETSPPSKRGPESGRVSGVESPKKEGGECGATFIFNQSIFSLFFFLNKKKIPLRGECRHQNGVLGEFKRRVDVVLADWWCVKEGTPLLEECPLHP